jgi:DNA-binding beta-propeller fold protein YncE
VISTGTRTLTATYPLALDVRSVAAHAARVVAAGATRDGAAIAVIDPRTDRAGLVEIAAGEGAVADAVRISPDGRYVYAAVSDVYSGALVVVDVDQARVMRTITIGSPIRDVALSPDGGTAYVLSSDPRSGATITTVDLARDEVLASVSIDGSPIQLTLNPDGTRAYVVGDDQVSVMCMVTNETLGAITVDGRPTCVAALSVAPAASIPPYQVMATEMIGEPELGELEPAAV